ncbi:hypothetical protein VF13_41370 [Nostoc linckia z16]|nr:hypothetical protein VF13_41370 [Nostoc linckia z16]
MNSYVALLRGINVSGQKIIKMENLRNAMESRGFQDVKTYIQSGNIVFKSDKPKNTLQFEIADLIVKEYGFEVSVFVLDREEMYFAVENNPFSQAAEPEPAGVKKLYITFLEGTPEPANFEKLINGPIGEDKVDLKGNVLYFLLKNSAADSKLSNNYIESKLKLKATTRNWNTTLKLLEMMKA